MAYALCAVAPDPAEELRSTLKLRPEVIMLVLRQHRPYLNRIAQALPASPGIREESGNAPSCWRSPLALGLLLYAIAFIAVLLAID